MFRASLCPSSGDPNCVPLPIVVCPVVAVVMLERRVACHPTLQHHNSYNRTDNYRQWNAVGISWWWA